MNNNRTKAVAWAIVWTVSAGAFQLVSMAQPHGDSQHGGGGGGMMGGWGGTGQYGTLEIVGLMIGIAILVLLVVLAVQRRSKTS